MDLTDETREDLAGTFTQRVAGSEVLHRLASTLGIMLWAATLHLQCASWSGARSLLAQRRVPLFKTYGCFLFGPRG